MAREAARNVRLAVMSAAALAMGLCACAPAPAPAPPEGQVRFVSLNPCTDAILVEVADPAQVLAISHYSIDPAASSIAPERARRFAATGGTAEEVAALRPDVVLAGSFIAPATRAALTDLGFRTESFAIAANVEQSIAQIRRIAALAGHPARGEALIARIEAALTANAAPDGRAPVSVVLWQPGEIVPGERTLVSELMRRTGFASHSAALGLGQADHLSLEQVLADPPRVLLVAGNSRGQAHPALRHLSATSVEDFDPALLYCAGPSIIRAADRLGAIRRGLD